MCVQYDSITNTITNACEVRAGVSRADLDFVVVATGYKERLIGVKVHTSYWTWEGGGAGDIHWSIQQDSGLQHVRNTQYQ